MKTFFIAVCFAALACVAVQAAPAAVISTRPDSSSLEKRVPTCDVLYRAAFSSIVGLDEYLRLEEESVIQAAPEVTKQYERLKAAYAKGTSEGTLASMADYTEILAASAALREALDATKGFSEFFRVQVKKSNAAINKTAPSWLQFCRPEA